MRQSSGGDTNEARENHQSQTRFTQEQVMNPIIKELTAHQLKNDIRTSRLATASGPTPRSGRRQERIQVFSGIVIARKGHGIHEAFTVRRISYGEGVERVFPVNSPMIDKIEVERESQNMRARLYYLRNRVGKKAVQVKEKRWIGLMGGNEATEAAAAQAETPAQS
jgi:large subunit ribosomal protein L19